MGVIQKKKHKSVRLRLTPGTPLATVVSTGHIPMEPTCTHAPIAMETASFTSVRLRLILRVSLRVSLRLRLFIRVTLSLRVCTTTRTNESGTEDFRVKTCFNFHKFSHKRVPLKKSQLPFS